MKKRVDRLIYVCLFLLFSVMFSLAGNANALDLDAIDSGHYSNTGLHVASNPNYIVGEFTVDNEIERNFFVFDLSGVTQQIVGATLTIYNPSGGYSSNDPSETWTLYDVTTPIVDLTASGGGATGGINVYNDLGSGTMFGSATVTSASNNTLVNVNLNNNAVAALNAARGGSFAIGGALTSLDGNINTEEVVFKFSSSGTEVRRLTLQFGTDAAIGAPALTEWGMILMGVLLGGSAIYLMRKKRTV